MTETEFKAEPVTQLCIITPVPEDDNFELAQKANVLSGQKWMVVKRAAEMLEKQKIPYVLMGTAALAAHGIMPQVVPDVDFLVAMRPDVPAELKAYSIPNSSDPEGNSGAWRFPMYLDADEVGRIKVDFVDSDDAISKGFLATKACNIDGVRVMSVSSALGIKRWRNREKDVEFIELVESGAANVVDAVDTEPF